MVGRLVFDLRRISLGMLLACHTLLGAAAWCVAETLPSGEAVPPPLRIHAEARRILDGMKSSAYQHKTAIDEAKGSYRCDCSGLVGYIVRRSLEIDETKPLCGKRRPKAVHFHDTFAAAPLEAGNPGRWQRIPRLLDAQPGDIIAWRRVNLAPGQHTGHVVVLDEPPTVEGDLIRAVIIDSTTKPHADDTRRDGQTGIGRGTMWFRIDAQGTPVAHIRNSPSAKPVEEPIAIGRAIR